MSAYSAAGWRAEQRSKLGGASGERLKALQYIFLALGILIVGRLYYLQIWNGKTYRLLATSQHELQELLVPVRGRILVRDRADDTLHPLATNRDAWLLYGVPKAMNNPGEVARSLASYVDKTEAELVERWMSNPDDPYDPLAKSLSTEQAREIEALRLAGVGLVKGWARFYPEQHIGGHVVGFVRTEENGLGKGVYGIEGSFDDVLAGKPGYVTAQKDAGGRRLMLGGGDIREAVNGADVILTIDRTIQYETCKRLKAAVTRYEAAGGSVIIMNPNTGAIITMCSVPDFDPARYGDVKNLAIFNNPNTFAQYEPGSVFKPFTMAIGIERNVISPNTTYNDPGVEKIDDFEIKNFDKQSHGVKTMTQVLEESLNTGTIFVQRLIGKEAFAAGVRAFGFGKKTGIELTPEAEGNILGLAKKADVYYATASFGQGISVTPVQLITAFAALANGGRLMKPHIVDEILRPDGTRQKTEPASMGTPISARTAQLVTGMLVSVVERGHGKRARVPGYYVAGKTGTAQMANPRGAGYLEGVYENTFIGYAPADNPVFVMLVKFDRPLAGKFAEVTSAPFWSELATFVLAYLEVPTERDQNAVPESSAIPDVPADLSTAPDAVSIDTENGPVLDRSGNNGQEGVQNEGSAQSPPPAGESDGTATPQPEQ